MKVDLFDFDLPETCIATRPAVPRDSARLLRVDGATLADQRVTDIVDHFQAGDVLVLNDTKVIPARLFGKRNMAKIEILLHKQCGLNQWQAFARPAKKLKPADTITFASDFHAQVLEKRDGGEVVLEFNGTQEDTLHRLETHGHLPLPPYMRREDDAQDRTDYQTVYAVHKGAVAAPTAGLHFTENLLNAIRTKGVHIKTVTLHVGAGTFLPVKVDDTTDHKMHAEIGLLDQETAAFLQTAKTQGHRIIAAGTTSLRLLETAARSGSIQPFAGETDIFITPGFQFHAVDMLMTNFHLPKSTLFMLVSAFAGLETMQAAYAHAIANGYRFYSYGDSSLLTRADRLS
jgi:S-adenosylmethionine:tRNA ribosyltransferase-isomerase